MMLIAWRMFTHDIGRSALAIAGVSVAILMVFLQLGFYAAVPVGGMIVYDRMLFDIMLTSSSYVFQGQPFEFPRRRVFQVLGHPDVQAAAPVYQDSVPWFNEENSTRRDIVLLGVRPEDRIFDSPEIQRQTETLRKQDTVLVDSATYPVFGLIAEGRRTEIGNRAVTIGGHYSVGIGFLGLGVALVSDQSFVRLAPNRTFAGVNFGLVHVKPGADPERVAADLRGSMPADIQVFTRKGLTSHEINYWLIRTSTGIVFGFGLVVAIVVGVVILYQVLSLQVARQLPQYAVLKAMGYLDRHLGGIVICLALIVVGFAIIPAIGATVIIYRAVHDLTRLPIEMTQPRLVTVWIMTMLMASASALFAMRVARRADPADIL